MADEPKDGADPKVDAFEPGKISVELVRWGRAIRDGAEGPREFGFEYERTPHNRRSYWVARIDAWVEAIHASWNALRDRIDADRRP